jgi:hypothetical protein
VNSETFVTSFIDQSSFVVVNEKMIKMLKGDCVSAVLLSRLISLYSYFKSTHTLEDDGWFFQKVKDIEDKLGINDYHQRKSFTMMETMGFIKMNLIGSPPVRYFFINFKAIEKALAIEAKPPKPPKKQKTQGDFYTALNTNESYDKIDNVRGNIPRPMAEFMYAFKRGVGYSFEGWSPKTYGMLSQYMDKVYFKSERRFSYSRLVNWINSNGSKTVAKFIEYDKNSFDDLAKPMTITNFLKELA